MGILPGAGPSWSTAARGGSGGGQSHDLVDLHAHLLRCHGAAGRGFLLRCGVEALHAFVLARFVTTVLAVTVVSAALVWWMV
ncbi:MAG: hypothetical protein ACK57J_08860 [Rubrivivax sp.]